MKLKNTTGDTVHLPTLGLSAAAGETIEVTGDAAQSLLDQGWKRADRPRKRTAKKAAPKSEAPADRAAAGNPDPDPGAGTEEASASDSQEG